MKDSGEIPVHITAQTPLLPAIRAWEVYLQDQGKSPYTIKSFISDLSLLAGYLPPDRALGEITTRELNNFLGWLQHGRGVPCSPKSLSRRITAIKAFFRWLHQNGRIAADPAEKVIQYSVISPLPQVLTPEEEARVLEAAEAHRHARKPDARPYVLISLLLSTGIKKGECLAIHRNHIDLSNPEAPLLFIRYANPRHRYKERKLELPVAWAEVYQEYLEQYKPQDTVFPWSARRLEYLLEDIGEEAGLTKHLSFDMCRWTCALRDWQRESDRDKVRQKLGLSKIQWREISMKLHRLAAETETSVGASKET